MNILIVKSSGGIDDTGGGDRFAGLAGLAGLAGGVAGFAGGVADCLSGGMAGWRDGGMAGWRDGQLFWYLKMAHIAKYHLGG